MPGATARSVAAPAAPSPWTGGSNGGQPGHTPLQACNGFAGGCLRRALKCGQIARRAGTAGLPAIGLVNVLEDLRERAVFVVAGDGGDLLQARGLTEGADEAAAGAGGPTERGPLAQNHGPRVEAGDGQNQQNAKSHGANIAHQRHQRVGAVSDAGFSRWSGIILQ
jgi:hypothetical protein